jgi:hypothetical protein
MNKNATFPLCIQIQAMPGLNIFLPLFLCFSVVHLSGQSYSLESYHKDGWRTNKKAMTVLGGWATSNVVVSGVLLGQHQGAERAFHQMNVGWNLVNLSIAGLGYWHTSRQLRRPPGSPGEILRQQQKIRQSLLFNAGLDLAYVTAGAWMMDRGVQADRPDARLEGFGKSLLLQGGFLFLFDISFFLIHQHSDKKLFQSWSLEPQGMGMTLRKAW